MAAQSITYMDDSLYKAAARGETEKFKGISLESLQTPNRNNVLHVNLAARKGCIKFTEEMLNQCPSLLLQVNAQGRTPLHIAARRGDSDIVKFLIRFRHDQGGDLEQQETALEAVRRMLRMTDLNSDTALHVAAAEHWDVGVVQELVEFEDPNYSYSVNKNQETPVYIAAERGREAVLSTILDKLKSAAHVGPKGRTALHAAAMSDSAGATRTILEKIGGNLTKEMDENGHTPLHYAAHLGNTSVVEVLLGWDKRAAYMADNKLQMTPLLMAARQGCVDTVKTILSFCPDCWQILDKRGWNFLHFLAFSERINFRFGHTLKEKFNLSDVKAEYGFGSDLFYAKDESGITPRVVNLVCAHPLRSSSNQCRRIKEQVMKLLEDTVNEQVAELWVRTPSIDQNIADINEVKQSHLLVATLIATVTFAAGITVPGGYKSEKGPDQGTPFLLRDAAFIAFVLSDAFAFFCSVFAVVIHFRTAEARGDYVHFILRLAAGLIVLASWALMIAYYTAIFAVLRPSLGVAIFSLCFGIIFHLFIFFVDQYPLALYRKKYKLI